MNRPSVEVQAHNLAELLAGANHQFIAHAAEQLLEGKSVLERTGPTTFTLTTQSGTKLEFNVKVLDAGA